MPIDFIKLEFQVDPIFTLHSPSSVTAKVEFHVFSDDKVRILYFVSPQGGVLESVRNEQFKIPQGGQFLHTETARRLWREMVAAGYYP